MKPARRVLVTGATGTVGGAIVDALLADPAIEVHAVCRHRAPQDHNRLVIHRLDLSRGNFAAALTGQPFDAIIHAAQPRGRDSNKAETGEDFDWHVVQELERLRRQDHPQTWLYTSGVWIYGHQTKAARIDESTPFRPFHYAKSRLRVLEHLRQPDSPPWVEVVVYGHEGPLQDIAQSLRQAQASVMDDPEVQWSLVERADAGRLFRRLRDRDYADRVFLVAEPESLSIAEVNSLLAAYLGAEFRATPTARLRDRVPPEDFEIMSGNQPVDASRVQQVTGWKPRFVFRRDFPRFVAHRFCAESKADV